VFRILGRLRDELGVNSTCGASNVSFGLPNREGINAAFLTMAIASGLTSAITNPIAEGVRHAVMAADVLQGNDPDAARWIRTFRVAPAEGEAGRRVNRRRGSGGRPTAPNPAETGDPNAAPVARG
jgi:5-methyltetrahydrofolate--homocysteine methyltransferase